MDICTTLLPILGSIEDLDSRGHFSKLGSPRWLVFWKKNGSFICCSRNHTNKSAKINRNVPIKNMRYVWTNKLIECQKTYLFQYPHFNVIVYDENSLLIIYLLMFISNHIYYKIAINLNQYQMNKSEFLRTLSKQLLRSHQTFLESY